MTRRVGERWRVASHAMAAGAVLVAAGCGCPSVPAAAPCPCGSAEARPAVPKPEPKIQQCTETAAAEPKTYDVEAVDDIGVLRLYADGFVDLTPSQRVLGYWLSRAAIAGDAIVYGQRNRYGLAIKELCEELVLHERAVDPLIRPAIELFAKRLWIHKGLYDTSTGRKLALPLRREELLSAARAAFRDGAKLTGVSSDADLTRYLTSLDKILFDPAFEPKMSTHSATSDVGGMAGASATYYAEPLPRDTVNQAEPRLADSRAGTKVGTRGEGWRHVGGDTGSARSNGPYAAQLSRMADALRHAVALASDAQRRRLELLVRYLETGERQDFDKGTAAWMTDDSPVDVALGVFDRQADPKQRHGEFLGAVFAPDKQQVDRMKMVLGGAVVLEQRMPWLRGYWRTAPDASLPHGVLPLTLTGAFGALVPAEVTFGREVSSGGNLESKSVYLPSVAEAIGSVAARALAQGFLPSSAQAADTTRCIPAIDSTLLTLREALVRGADVSGRVGKPGSRVLPPGYEAILDRARADLTVLSVASDPKLVELGLLPDRRCSEFVAESYPALLLFRGALVPDGAATTHTAVRAQALVVRYAMDRGAVREEKREGSVVLAVTDLVAWNTLAVELLSELVRIKAQDDRGKVKELVDRYGAPLPGGWRDDAVARLQRLGIPRRYAFLSPRIKPLLDDKGNVVDATIVDTLTVLDTLLVDAGKRAVP